MGEGRRRPSRWPGVRFLLAIRGRERGSEEVAGGGGGQALVACLRGGGGAKYFFSGRNAHQVKLGTRWPFFFGGLSGPPGPKPRKGLKKVRRRPRECPRVWKKSFEKVFRDLFEPFSRLSGLFRLFRLFFFKLFRGLSEPL